jgi:hypothetical protein
MNPTNRRPRSTAASPGLDDPSATPAGDRVAELEERLARLERRVTLADRGRSLMDQVIPPEATRHFRQAGREQLLGMRTIVDFWIERIDRREARAGGGSVGGGEPERIEIE